MIENSRTRVQRVLQVLDDQFGGRQNEFADTVHVNKGMVSEWRNGKKGMTLATVIKIADRLRGVVNYRWLVYGEKPQASGQQADGPTLKQRAIDFDENNLLYQRKIKEIEEKLSGHHQEFEEGKHEMLEAIHKLIESARRRGWL